MNPVPRGRVCPLSVVFEFLTIFIKKANLTMLNKKELEMRRKKPLWSLSGLHNHVDFV